MIRLKYQYIKGGITMNKIRTGCLCLAAVLGTVFAGQLPVRSHAAQELKDSGINYTEFRTNPIRGQRWRS